MKYLPHLDILRAISVMMVLLGHWTPHDSLLQVLGGGKEGVTMFFVLSGYLIPLENPPALQVVMY